MHEFMEIREAITAKTPIPQIRVPQMSAGLEYTQSTTEQKIDSMAFRHRQMRILQLRIRAKLIRGDS
jgi:hypothetical protein